jgi:ABC-type transport system substrate-binding protein
VLIPRQRQPDRPYRAGFPAFEFLKQPSDVDSPVRAHSAQTPLPENSYSGTNRSRYRNAEFDALLNRYLVTVPIDERLEITRAIVHHMTDQVVWMGLFYDTEPLLVSNRLKNVSAGNAPPALSTWNAYRWDVAG